MNEQKARTLPVGCAAPIIVFVVLCVCIVRFILPNLPLNVTLRYKITVNVDTPAGQKRGFGIVELRRYQDSFGSRVLWDNLQGEAVYVDLGINRRPLVALMTSSIKGYRQGDWVWVNGPNLRFLYKLYGEKQPPSRGVDPQGELQELAHFATKVGPRELAPSDLPDLVTFANTADRLSIIEVNPRAPQDALGPGVTLRSITFEFTEDPATAGIESKLPFLRSWICSGEYDFLRERRTVNDIGYWSFKQWYNYYEKWHEWHRSYCGA